MSEENENSPAPKAFKAFRTSRPFVIQLEEDGPELVYTVRAMLQKEKSQWQNVVADRIKFNPAGKPTGMSKYDGLESSLIEKCLLDPDGKPVPMKVIDDWAAPLVAALFKECQEVNGMSKEAEDAAKN